MTEPTGEGRKLGAWRIEERKIITNDGITDGWFISDGNDELLTTEDPLELMLAIASLMGVKSFEDTDDEPGEPVP